jgi:hypothetical protein
MSEQKSVKGKVPMDVTQKQRAVIEFLVLEGRAGEEITIRLHDVYGEDADSRATVFRWINRIRRSDGELESEKPPGRPPRYETDRQIQEIIRDHPFASLRMIAEMLGLSSETVRLHLLRIGSVLKALHRISHTLTEDLKRVRVQMCSAMLTALQVQEHDQWHNVITGDESWFYFEYVPDRLWISSLVNAPDVPNRTIATEKHIVTVFWNPDGFRVVTILPKGASFNTAWFIDGNLLPLRDQFFPGGRRPGQKKLMVHVDNASPHTAQMTRNFFMHNGFRKLAHPPSSADIAPSDFYLFGKVKNELIGKSNHDEHELFLEVTELLSAIPTTELRDVFRNWIRPLEQVIDTNGEYVS